jgi:hypothetical protein
MLSCTSDSFCQLTRTHLHAILHIRLLLLAHQNTPVCYLAKYVLWMHIRFHLLAQQNIYMLSSKVRSMDAHQIPFASPVELTCMLSCKVYSMDAHQIPFASPVEHICMLLSKVCSMNAYHIPFASPTEYTYELSCKLSSAVTFLNDQCVALKVIYYLMVPFYLQTIYSVK